MTVMSLALVCIEMLAGLRAAAVPAASAKCQPPSTARYYVLCRPRTAHCACSWERETPTPSAWRHVSSSRWCAAHCICMCVPLSSLQQGLISHRHLNGHIFPDDTRTVATHDSEQRLQHPGWCVMHIRYAASACTIAKRSPPFLQHMHTQHTRVFWMWGTADIFLVPSPNGKHWVSAPGLQNKSQELT